MSLLYYTKTIHVTVQPSLAACRLQHRIVCDVLHMPSLLPPSLPPSLPPGWPPLVVFARQWQCHHVLHPHLPTARTRPFEGHPQTSGSGRTHPLCPHFSLSGWYHYPPLPPSSPPPPYPQHRGHSVGRGRNFVLFPVQSLLRPQPPTRAGNSRAAQEALIQLRGTGRPEQ